MNQFENLLVCPKCGAIAKLRTGDFIYGCRYAHINLYVCSNWPECDCYVGCHKGTEKPLGTLADAATREWRKRAHGVFDRLWKSRQMSRAQAYRQLREQLELTKKEAHIGRMSASQCKRVVEIFG